MAVTKNDWTKNERIHKMKEREVISINLMTGTSFVDLKNTIICQHCGQRGLPSVWTLLCLDGTVVSLRTDCANRMRRDTGRYMEDDNTYVIEELAHA